MSGVPIERATDLYLVVREHCDAAKLMGHVVQVEALEPAHPTMYLRCLACKQEYAHNAVHALIRDKQAYHPLAWLKRIPPLGELDDVKRDEEITA